VAAKIISGAYDGSVLEMKRAWLRRRRKRVESRGTRIEVTDDGTKEMLKVVVLVIVTWKDRRGVEVCSKGTSEGLACTD